MGSYEWMELQTLTAEIDVSRSRLGAARSKRDHGRARALQEEIAAAEARRDRLLAYISTNLASVPESARPPAGMEGAKLREALASAAAIVEIPSDDAAAEAQPGATENEADAAPAAEPPGAEANDKPQSAEPTGAVIAAGATSATVAAKADGAEAGSRGWIQLTPGDIARVKHDIGVRRAEMAARHAEELKRLEADQAELDTLAQAIAAFAKKFANPAVVSLDKQRELRQQSAG